MPIVSAVVAWALLAVLVPATAAAAGGQPPYVAFVRSEKALVRSGPGINYYPTSELRYGDKVEVFRHDPGGWCAIKPPSGSFSWIPSESVEIGSDGLALVTRADVPCRVGSQLSESQDVVQVHVQKGEVVEVLGILRTGEAGGRSWVKVSPPSGEFRWIAQDALDRSLAAGASQPAEQHGHPSVGAAPLVEEPPSTAQASGSEPLAPLAAVVSGLPKADEPPNGSGRPSAETAASVGQEAVAQVAGPLDPAALEQEINSVDLELSLELTKPALEWELAELERRARRVVEQSPQPPDGERARQLLARVTQAQELRKRYEAIATVYADFSESRPPQSQSPVLPQVAEQNAAPVQAAAGGTPSSPSDASAGRFDGTGRLVRVLPPKLGAPRYALLDAQGNIAVYLTPAPDLNLQYYLGRQVGVNGIRGYVAEKRTEHITAKNVTLLDRPPLH